MYRAAYTVTALKKSGWYDKATYLNEKTQIIPTFYPLKNQSDKNYVTGKGDFKFNAPNEKVNAMVGSGSDSDFVKKISKTFMKSGEEKGVNYVYPVDRINPIREKQKSSIIINAEIFMGTWFVQNRETTDGT